MQAAVALSKLKVKNVRLDTGVGGIPDLTPEDIAAGLAGCKPGPVYLGLYKYSGDNTSLPLLEQHVMAHVGIQGYAQKLFDDKDYSAICRYLNIWIKGVSVESSNALTEDERNWCKTLHQLVRLLVNDVVFENRHKACNGTGVYQGRICKGCSGSGRKIISLSEQARRLNVSNHIYATHWQDLFERFVPMLQSWEQTVLEHLQRKLYDAKEQELIKELAFVS